MRHGCFLLRSLLKGRPPRSPQLRSRIRRRRWARKNRHPSRIIFSLRRKTSLRQRGRNFPSLRRLSQEVKKPIVRPQITLYGVTIGENYQSASISYPGRPLQKGEREIMTVKIGDRIGDYKLAKILPDRIGLEAPEDNFEVLLYDARTPKRRVVARTENKPAAVTSTLPTPAQPPRPAPARVAGTGAIGGKISEMPGPRPVTPAPIPGSRARRIFGPKPPGEE